MSSSRVLLHLQGETFSRRYQVASHAITSAAAGDEVVVVLWFDALRKWVRGGFDEAGASGTGDGPVGGESSREGPVGGTVAGDAVTLDAGVAMRHHELGLPPPSAMLQEARALGAKIWACETAVRLSGLLPQEAREKVDELPGLQEILAAAKDADLVLYI